MTQETSKKWYILVGSNNFWYAYSDDLEELRKQAQAIISLKDDDDSGYSDPESGHRPLPPDTLYLYEVKEINSFDRE
jgi:hypothetical protein